jgi:hypothetical protein
MQDASIQGSCKVSPVEVQPTKKRPAKTVLLIEKINSKKLASDSSAHPRSMALYLVASVRFEWWPVPIFQLGGPGVLDFGNAVLNDAFEFRQCGSVPVGIHIELTEGFAKNVEEILIGLKAHGLETSFAGATVHGTSLSSLVV